MRHLRAKSTSLFSALVLTFVLLSVSASYAQNSDQTPERFNGEQALKYAAAQVEFGARPTGSEALIKMGDYVIKTLQESGWTVETQPFDVQVDKQVVKARNIIATIGTGPSIILGAHYDTRIYATNDPIQDNRLKPVLGANDGASGVAVLMELARVLGKGYSFNHQLMIVLFDAEDNGNIPGWPGWTLGATYYVSKIESDNKPQYMILLDMIGDKDLNIYHESNSLSSAPDLVHGIWDTAAELGFQESFIPNAKYNMIDDHIPFIEAGIPAIDLIDFDYPYWHTVGDTLDKLSAESLAKVGLTVQTYLEKTNVITPDPNATVAPVVDNVSATAVRTP
jgi:glutaminyl-peptide cyclotransferase